MKKIIKSLIIASSAMFLTLLIDQVSKLFVCSIELSDPVTNKYHIISLFEKLIGNFGTHFFLINVRHHFEFSQLLTRVVVLPLIGLYLIYYLMRRRISSPFVFLGLGLLIGALCGNAIDIIARGYVIDWIGCSFFLHTFELNYAINIADIIAVLSAPMILISIRRAERFAKTVTTIPLPNQQEEFVA